MFMQPLLPVCPFALGIQMKKHTTTVLSAMVTGMDDREDPNDDITLEAMNGLSKILAKVSQTLALQSSSSCWYNR